MKEITIDCRGFIPRSDLHQALSGALSFPDWYGNNLDALYDMLTSLGEDVLLTLLHWEDAEKNLGHYAHNAKRAILDAEKKNSHLTVQFL